MRHFWGSLAFRVLALLTLALIPLGSIGVYQTSMLSQKLSEQAKAALLTRAQDDVARERQTFERAFGAAEAIGALTLPLLDDRARCRAELERLTAYGTFFTFAALMPPDGFMDCVSTDKPVDASSNPRVPRIFSEAKPYVSATPGPVSGVEVLLIGQPVFVGETTAPAHFVMLSVPVTHFLKDDADTSLVAKGILARDGRLLKVLEGQEDDLLPSDLDFGAMVSKGTAIFEARTSSGDIGLFSVLPLYGDAAYAIAAWEPEALPGKIGPWILPIAMWLATLGVAYFAINELVVKRVRDLREGMLLFSRNRTLPDFADIAGQPVEFAEMIASFSEMASAVTRDEADLKDALNEKSLLLREVHHRVKNNLQLIASIINMQKRNDQSEEMQDAMGRLQKRVLGLAAVHGTIYEADSLVEIPAHELLQTIVDQNLELLPAQARCDVAFDALELGPDQAILLAMIATEAVANALKHACKMEGSPKVAVTLKVDGEKASFSVENTIIDDSDPYFSATGLGMRLIGGLASQMNAQLNVLSEHGLFKLHLSFTPQVQPQSFQGS